MASFRFWVDIYANKKGMKIADVEKAVGVPEGKIKNVDSYLNVSGKTLQDIAELLEVEVDVLKYGF